MKPRDLAQIEQRIKRERVAIARTAAIRDHATRMTAMENRRLRLALARLRQASKRG